MFRIVTVSGRPFNPDGRVPMPVQIREKYESQWLANKHVEKLNQVMKLGVKVERF